VGINIRALGFLDTVLVRRWPCCRSGRWRHLLTLGTSDAGIQNAIPRDNFIDNVADMTEIVMQFNFKIYGISFDYEIFPDGPFRPETTAA